MARTERDAEVHHELGAQFYRLGQLFIAGETPILAAQGLTMWDYVVLLALHDTDAITQLQLAGLTGRDKTRLIGNLDNLEAAGLVSRSRDQQDRRAMNVRITPMGREKVTACRAEIRQMEVSLLADVPEDDQIALRSLLTRLTGTLSKYTSGPGQTARSARTRGPGRPQGDRRKLPHAGKATGPQA